MGPATQAGSHTANWIRRVERARELQQHYPAAADILRFYAEVLQLQKRIAQSAHKVADPDVPLNEQIDLPAATRWMPHLLGIVETRGPVPLAELAIALKTKDTETWRELLIAEAAGELEQETTPERFFARTCLQPLAELLQAQYPASTDQSALLCSVCGHQPVLAILRPEGEGARRSLFCSFCMREWTFRRVLCPSCGETDRDKLPYYTAEQCKHIRVEACDTCRHYLKSVDLSLDGLAIPLVDEIALAALDLWAVEHGYRKIAANLMGL